MRVQLTVFWGIFVAIFLLCASIQAQETTPVAVNPGESGKPESSQILETAPSKKSSELVGDAASISDEEGEPADGEAKTQLDPSPAKKAPEVYQPNFGVLDPSTKPDILIVSPGFDQNEPIVMDQREGIFEIRVSTFSPITSISINRIETYKKKDKRNTAIGSDIKQPTTETISTSNIEESEEFFEESEEYFEESDEYFEEEISLPSQPIAITYKSKTPTALALAVPFNLIKNPKTGQYQEHFRLIVESELGREIENFFLVQRDRKTEKIPVFNPLPEGIVVKFKAGPSGIRSLPETKDGSTDKAPIFEPNIEIVSPTYGDKPIVDETAGRYRFIPGFGMNALQGEQETLFDVKVTTLSKIKKIIVQTGPNENQLTVVEPGGKFGLKQEQAADTLVTLVVPTRLRYNSDLGKYSAIVKVIVTSHLGTVEKVFPLIEAEREGVANFQLSLIGGLQNFGNVNKATGNQTKVGGIASYYIIYPRYDFPSTFSEKSVYRLSYLHSGKKFMGKEEELQDAETTLNQLSLTWKNIETAVADFELAIGLNDISKKSEYSVQGSEKAETDIFASGTVMRILPLLNDSLRVSLHFEMKSRTIHDDTILESYNEDGMVTRITPMLSFTTPENSGKLYAATIQNESKGVYKKSSAQEIGIGYNYLWERHIFGGMYTSRTEKFAEIDPWYNASIETKLSRIALKETYRQNKSLRYMFEIISESESSNVDDSYSDMIMILSIGWKFKTTF